MSIDPITLQVIQARLAGIVQEMQNSLFRTGYSTIIRESQDASDHPFPQVIHGGAAYPAEPARSPLVV